MTQAPSASLTPSRRYLALFCPWLPAERARAAGLAPPDARSDARLGARFGVLADAPSNERPGTLANGPLALFEKRSNALHLAALSPEALALGLEVDMPLADARARLPDLMAIPHDPTADAAMLARLARAMHRLSPSVSLDPPAGLMLDVTGCAHLHGGEVGLRRAVRRASARHRLSVRLAIAGTPDAARALARYGADDRGAAHDEDVTRLPLIALAVPAESHHALRRAGLRRIGDVAALSTAALAARFGPALPLALARLLGDEDQRTAPERPDAPILQIARFAEPVARTAHMLAIIERLAGEAATALAERGLGGRAFLVRLHRSDGHVARLTVETGAPTRDPALLLRLITERIESLADPLDPGFGYDSIDLAVPRTDPLADVQAALVEERRRPPPLAPLLDRLAVRHGAERVLRLHGGDSHIPEIEGQLRPRRDPTPAAPWRSAATDAPPTRPLTLFDPPEAVQVIAEVPEGPPRRFSWRGRSYRIVAQEGPERIAAQWWTRPGGHAGHGGRTRDYYRVEDEAGHRFWLFCHGLYGAENDAPRWYLHGLFA